jgi:hypothetical protein
MVRSPRVETVQKTFAELTGALEDASLVAAEGQTASIADARQIYDRLIAVLEPCLRQLKCLRRRLQ